MLRYLEHELMYELKKMSDGIPTRDMEVYSNVSILGAIKRREEIAQIMEKHEVEELENQEQ